MAAPVAAEPGRSRATPGRTRIKLPRGYWGSARVRPILDQIQVIPIRVDLAGLAPGERAAVDELLAAGREVQDLAELMEHHQALDARARLAALHDRLGRPAETADLQALYRFSQGPIATTLDNELLPFLPVDGFSGGRNVYPWAIEAAELQAFIDAHPEQRSDILGLHTVVRRTTPTALRRDLATLRKHPGLAMLHPGLDGRLTTLAGAATPDAFYAVPYSVAWHDRMRRIAGHVWRAGELVEPEDRDFAAFLRQRSRDLLTDDNEAGDATWVRGSFGHLDVVLGAYEPYDDDLFGAKAFFALSLFRRDEPSTAELRARLPHLQAMEDALPIGRHRLVKADLPVGAYDAIAAFAQGRGTSAEILPNDPELARKYGRKIMLRRNTVVQPEAMVQVTGRWRAVMAPVHHDELTPEGVFRQITWHEVGHYLGPDTDHLGRALEATLVEDAAAIEELKSELASIFCVQWLARIEAFSREDVHGVVAYAVSGGFQPSRPLRSQPYRTIWLMLSNFFLDQGVLWPTDAGLRLDHDRVWEATVAMLGDVLALQDRGTRADSNAYIERWTAWDERHEAIAARIRAVERYRFREARFLIAEEPPITPPGRA
ncbi:MAG TPA: hypothetical protein VGJ17_00040 [Candidatus Limnocylindrales bacterium]|jgi:hypothetical protein